MEKIWDNIIKIIFYGFSEIPTSVNYLHINCTSNGLGKRPKVPIFSGKNIYLQSIHECQQVSSAAILGALEARYSDNDEVILLIAYSIILLNFAFY